VFWSYGYFREQAKILNTRVWTDMNHSEFKWSESSFELTHLSDDI